MSEPRPLNVALVTPGWPPGAFPNGVIPCVESAAESLRALGHRATILAQNVAPGTTLEPGVVDVRRYGPEAAGFCRLVDRLARRIAPSSHGARMAARPIVRALGTEALRGVDIVEMEEVFGWARGVQRGGKRPMVVRLHGPWFLNGPLQGARIDAEFRERVRSEGRAIAQADGVTAPSRDVLDRTREHYQIPLPQARVIFNPAPTVADDRLWRRDRVEPGSVLFVGRFDLHKGGDLILDAFARVASDRPEAKLWFAGPDLGLTDAHGRLWSLPEYVAQRCGTARDRVHCLGRLDRAAIEALRPRAAATVVCSRYETFGITLVEAMAHGCPVVASRAGAFPELVSDGETGLLCPPDDPAELALAIGRLLDDPDFAEALGRRAVRASREFFDARILAERTAAYYRTVLGDSPSAEPRSR